MGKTASSPVLIKDWDWETDMKAAGKMVKYSESWIDSVIRILYNIDELKKIDELVALKREMKKVYRRNFSKAAIKREKKVD